MAGEMASIGNTKLRERGSNRGQTDHPKGVLEAKACWGGTSASGKPGNSKGRGEREAKRRGLASSWGRWAWPPAAFAFGGGSLINDTKMSLLLTLLRWAQRDSRVIERRLRGKKPTGLQNCVPCGLTRH